MEKMNRQDAGNDIIINRLSKSYGAEHVLINVCLSFSMGKTYCIMGPSGTGKTTLLRILMRLEQADSGEILGTENLRLSAVFQEDRLLDGFTVVENIRFVTGNRYSPKELTAVITRLLPEDSLEKPVCEFSGGMKRRAAILRAILAPSDIIIMDEPFTGLDRDTKLTAIALIKEFCAGKLLLVSTHMEEDAELLGAEILRLETEAVL